MPHKRSVAKGNPCSIPFSLPLPPYFYFFFLSLTVHHSLSVLSHNRPFPRSFYIAIIIMIKHVTIIDNSIHSYLYLSIKFLSLNIEGIVLHQSTYIFPCITLEMDTSIEMPVYLLLLVYAEYFNGAITYHEAIQYHLKWQNQL